MHLSPTFTALSLVCLASCTAVDVTHNRRSWSDLQPGLVRRQEPAPPAAGSEKLVQIVTVSDAAGALKFFPENIKADVGSVVQFQFYPKNHTITESSFDAPCVPIAANLTTAERPGQRSGFVPVSAGTEFRPIYNMIVNDTKPMWIFCGQKPHCAKGMSMVINENAASGKTLVKYQAAAAALDQSAGSPSASSSSAAASVTSSATASSSAAAGVTAGPTLAGTVTSAQAQGSTAGPIATFTGNSGPIGPQWSGWGVLLLGAAVVL